MEAFGGFAKVFPHMASLTQNILVLESGQIKPTGVMLMYIMCNPPGWLLRWSVGKNDRRNSGDTLRQKFYLIDI